MKKKQATRKKFLYNTILIILGIILGIIIGFLIIQKTPIYKTTKEETTTTTKQTTKPIKQDARALKTNTDIILGNKNAKVTIVEFTDYQCENCKHYDTETFNKIKTNYIDTNKIKYIIKDYPLTIHKNSLLASMTAICANEQGKYKEIRTTLYKEQKNWSNSTNPEKLFLQYIEQENLDKTKFENCINNPATKRKILESTQLGEKLNIQDTPTFLINDKKIIGAQSYEVLKTIIDSELKKL